MLKTVWIIEYARRDETFVHSVWSNYDLAKAELDKLDHGGPQHYFVREVKLDHGVKT